MLYSMASLNATELEAIQNLERRIGKRVLVMKPLEIEFDKLTEEEIAEIQQLEVDLGVAIVAVK